MLGVDGVAERQSVSLSTGLAAGTVLAAPGVGWYIRVVSSYCDGNALTFATLGDTTVGTLWQAMLGSAASGSGVFSDADCGTFECTPNEALLYTNSVPQTIRINVEYEIRPTGI